MDKVYLFLLTVAALLLLLDAYAGRTDRSERGVRYGVRLLPLALFFWVLVPWFQFAKVVF